MTVENLFYRKHGAWRNFLKTTTTKILLSCKLEENWGKFQPKHLLTFPISSQKLIHVNSFWPVVHSKDFVLQEQNKSSALGHCYFNKHWLWVSKPWRNVPVRRVMVDPQLICTGLDPGLVVYNGVGRNQFTFFLLYTPLHIQQRGLGSFNQWSDMWGGQPSPLKWYLMDSGSNIFQVLNPMHWICSYAYKMLNQDTGR